MLTTRIDRVRIQKQALAVCFFHFLVAHFGVL
jgi:hypothetical protein